MRAVLRFTVRHVTQFWPVECTHCEVRYNNSYYCVMMRESFCLGDLSCCILHIAHSVIAKCVVHVVTVEYYYFYDYCYFCFESGTDSRSLLILFFFFLLGRSGEHLQKSRTLSFFKSDQGEIWQHCSSLAKSDFWVDDVLSSWLPWHHFT